MIDTVGNTTSTAINSLYGKASGSSGSGALNKDTFLQLMMAQMSNQNPLEPMDSTQFLSQLAQFSSLEQMQNIASGMNTLALTQTAATNSQMVNLIGKRVIVPGDTVTWDGSRPAEVRFELPAGVSAVDVTIKDSSGAVQRRVHLDKLKAGANGFTFDGLDDGGKPLPAGNYTFQVSGANGQAVADLKSYANFLVDAVSFDGTNILLKSRGQSIALADVSEVIAN